MAALTSTTGRPRSRQPVVVVVVGRRLGVVAAGEDDPGDVLVEQHVDVVASETPSAVRVHSTGVNPRSASAPATTSAKAGKIGFCSSGSTRPTSRARWPRSLRRPLVAEDVECGQDGRRVASEMPGLSFRTRLTVASLTCAYAATSASRRAMETNVVGSPDGYQYKSRKCDRPSLGPPQALKPPVSTGTTTPLTNREPGGQARGGSLRGRSRAGRTGPRGRARGWRGRGRWGRRRRRGESPVLRADEEAGRDRVHAQAVAEAVRAVDREPASEVFDRRLRGAVSATRLTARCAASEEIFTMQGPES